jgi:hypothetical protein
MQIPIDFFCFAPCQGPHLSQHSIGCCHVFQRPLQKWSTWNDFNLDIESQPPFKRSVHRQLPWYKVHSTWMKHWALMSPGLNPSPTTSHATMWPCHFGDGESVYCSMIGHVLRRLLIILESSVKLPSKLSPSNLVKEKICGEKDSFSDGNKPILWGCHITSILWD